MSNLRVLRWHYIIILHYTFYIITFSLLKYQYFEQSSTVCYYPLKLAHEWCWDRMSSTFVLIILYLNNIIIVNNDKDDRMQKSAYYRATACEYVSLQYELLKKCSFDILSSNRISCTKTILFTVYITTIMNVVSAYMLILYAYLCTLCLWTRILCSRGFYVYYIYIFFGISFKWYYCCTEAYDYCILIEQ